MTVTVTVEPAGTRELQELYTRYKALALSTSAALMLDGEIGPIADRVEDLLESCRTLCARRDVHRREAAACAEATASLRPLLAGDTTPEALGRARDSHLRLRRAVWDVIPCEYVPCCAPAHDHHER